MVGRIWKAFKAKFEIIQQEKADIACAELLQTEAEEKAKVWAVYGLYGTCITGIVWYMYYRRLANLSFINLYL